MKKKDIITAFLLVVDGTKIAIQKLWQKISFVLIFKILYTEEEIISNHNEDLHRQRL